MLTHVLTHDNMSLQENKEPIMKNKTGGRKNND